MSKEAKYYHSLEDKKVKCQLCPHNCTIANGKRGICGVRENQDGKLYSLVYEYPCAMHVDPIEKKPLYHFLPGSEAFSIGTAGCNLSCMHCQNWSISKAKPESVNSSKVSTNELLEAAQKSGSESIAYTYNEPGMNFEHVLELSKAAHKAGLYNIMVTNGYLNKEPLNELYEYIDAANVDLKGFDKSFYKKICGAELEPVLNSLVLMHKKGVWLEITNLLIPGYNDDLSEIEQMCKWIVDNLGCDYPLHFSAFYPAYKLDDVPPTSLETLKASREVAQKCGLNYVYLGNVRESVVTVCPKCKRELIERSVYLTDVKRDNFVQGTCVCGEKIAGVWE
jgi:pyruvate formate lyase activating enzyme